MTDHKTVREALEAAASFIKNGVELGYITLPDVPCDPALQTASKIHQALAALQSPAVPREVVEKLRQIAQGTGTKDGRFQHGLIMSKDTMRELAAECFALLGGKEG